MKITAIAVTSLDGRFTKNSEKNIYHWSSPEDFAHFRSVVEKNNLLVMGSGTYEPVKNIKKSGLKPEKERLRVIMTKNPQKYKNFFIPSQMEFTDESPNQLVTRLEKRGYKRMLFVGGRKLFVTFLQAKLIDEMYITIEPQIFGNGDLIQTNKSLDIALELLSVKKLNKTGTLLLKYKILK